MAPLQKTGNKISFDDDLGDDFLSSWKPGERLFTNLDFDDGHDDQPASASKNNKKSFSLTKMDIEFDFDPGLTALSSFNIDMSDLDFPRTRSVPKAGDPNQTEQIKTTDNNKKGSSNICFEVNGFDDFDLEDTLKPSCKGPIKGGKLTSLQKEKEGSVSLKAEEPLNDLFQDDDGRNEEKESNHTEQKSDLIADQRMAHTRICHDKESHRYLIRGDQTADKWKSLMTVSSDDEKSQRRRNISPYASHKQTMSMESSRDCSTSAKLSSSSISDAASIADESALKQDDEEDHTTGNLAGDIEVMNKEKIPFDQLDSNCNNNIEALIPKQLESPKQSSKQRNRVNQPSLGSIDQKLKETEAEADSAREEATSDTVIPTNLTVKQQEIRSEISIRLGSEDETPFSHKVFPKALQESRCSKILPQSGTCMKSSDSQPVENANIDCHLQRYHDLYKAENLEKLPENTQSKRKFCTITEQSDCPSPAYSKENNTLDASHEAESDASYSHSSKRQCTDWPCITLTEDSRQQRKSLVPKSPLSLSSNRLHQANGQTIDTIFHQANGQTIDTIFHQANGQTIHTTEQTPSLQSVRSNISIDRTRVGGKYVILHTQDDGTQNMELNAESAGELQNHLNLLPSASVHPNTRNVDQISKMKSSNATYSKGIYLLGKNKANVGNGLIDTIKASSGGLSHLDRTKSIGILREASEKAFHFDLECESDNISYTESNVDLETRTEESRKLENELQAPTPAKLYADQVKASIEVEEQKVSHETVSDSFTNIINPNMKLSVNHTIPGILKPEIGKEGGVGSMLQVIRDEIHQPFQPTGANDLYAVEDVRDYGIADEKAEIYANHLDSLLKMLKEKQEEAMDLRVRALVVNNAFLILDNPADHEKIQKIVKHTQEKLLHATTLPMK